MEKKKKDFICLKDLSTSKLTKLIDLAIDIKNHSYRYNKVLSGQCIGLLFQKPSLRTKTAFYIGIVQLGGEAVYYAPEEIKIGQRESIKDVSRTLSRYLDAAVLRTFSHNDIIEFAKVATKPVINGLSDLYHPTQALADVMTICEYKGSIKGKKVCYIGDGNNVSNSLMFAFALLGGNLTVVTPKGYGPKPEVIKQVNEYAKKNKAKITVTNSIKQAVKDADVLYTDVWASMGQEKMRNARKKAFKEFQINDKLLKLTKADSIVMHCLPAHRGEEITDSVLDGKRSVVFTQAENRLHTAKAILVDLLRK